MNLKELKTPIRIYWDLTPAALDVPPDYLKICEELVGIKILSLNLVDTAPSLSLPCRHILERLANENIATTLALPGSALNPPITDLLRGFNVRALFLMVQSLDELRSLRHIWHEDNALRPGVYFEVKKDNHRDLPEVLSFCLGNDIPYLVLPMQRLTKGVECFRLDQRERDELAVRMNDVKVPPALKIVIHDPFLWKVFYPTVKFPDGGCQAANTMLYISPEGDVYPCPSLPIKLGTLQETTLKEIISSNKKRELRERLLRAPAGCVHCNELHSCMGGCRGRAYAMKGSLDVLDPGCG